MEKALGGCLSRDDSGSYGSRHERRLDTTSTCFKVDWLETEGILDSRVNVTWTNKQTNKPIVE